MPAGQDASDADCAILKLNLGRKKKSKEETRGADEWGVFQLNVRRIDGRKKVYKVKQVDLVFA
jgi:hypothetical protein